MVKYECGIKIECEKKDDGDLIFKEIIDTIKRLGNEGKLNGTVKYGYL